MTKKKPVLIITPSLVGGSWVALKQLAEIPNQRFRYIVLGLGNYKAKHKNFRVIAIPYFRYDSYAGHLASKYTVLGVIYKIPLYLISTLFILFLRPEIIIFNGLTTLIPLLLLTKALGIKVVLSFRSWFDEERFALIKGFLKFCGKSIDLAFVNSKGTEENLSIILPKERIFLVEHHADKIFFKQKNRIELRQKWNVNDKFIVLYVGRIDREKLCNSLFEFIKRLKNEKGTLFLFIGEGMLKKELIELQKRHNIVKYLGFIDDRHKLSEFYSIADIVWSCADESYLARPAIEALASGTPIIIPSTPAMGEKINKKVEINKSLFPQEIGWVINLENPQSVINLLLEIKDKKLALQKREKCFEYAKLHYLKDDNKLLLEKLYMLK